MTSTWRSSRSASSSPAATSATSPWRRPRMRRRTAARSPCDTSSRPPPASWRSSAGCRRVPTSGGTTASSSVDELELAHRRVADAQRRARRPIVRSRARGEAVRKGGRVRSERRIHRAQSARGRDSATGRRDVAGRRTRRRPSRSPSSACGRQPCNPQSDLLTQLSWGQSATCGCEPSSRDARRAVASGRPNGNGGPLRV